MFNRIDWSMKTYTSLDRAVDGLEHIDEES
jgi:hypothetical protein